MDENSAVLSRIETDLSNDRSRIDNIVARLGALEAKVDTLIARMPRVETKLKDAVHDAMSETTQPLTDLMAKINKSPKKKNLLEWFLKRGEK